MRESGERMKKVSFDLRPLCGRRTGIGLYAYEIVRRIRNTEDMRFCGQISNFLGRDDHRAAFEGIHIPIIENKIVPYRVNKKLGKCWPFSYELLSGTFSDLSVFFNYVIPPRVSGKVINTICDMTYMRFPETLDDENLARITKGVQRSIEKSSKIVTISEFSKKEIMDLLNIPEDRISIVSCAPSLTDEVEDFAQVQEKYGIGQPYILYVGSIEPRKNLARLIRAFDLLKREAGIEHQLVLAGGAGWNNEEIHQAAQQVSCRDDICFTGYISSAEKNTLYQHASLLAFPSLYEGFGMPPLEAMYWDCPVVCANAASLPEVVGDAAQLVDPLDEKSIAQGMFDVISNPVCAQSLIEKGHTQLQKYTWDASAQKLTDICKEVLE